jgi:nitrogen fixation-related uncharacterized protein
VRTYAPLRHVLLLGAAVVLAALSLYIAFEWGRSNAGFDGRSARAERSQAHDRIRELEDDNRKQRLQLAAHESERVGQTRERTELAKTIGDLQAQVARQAQDLAFYRGVVGDSASADIVKIQQFQVSKGAVVDEYRLRLVLGRPLRPEDAVAGKIRMTFEGATAATPVNLDLSMVSDVTNGELAFSYRYVETLEQTIRLPPGFKPARTTIELAPARKGVNPVRETFIWTVENR